MAEDGRSVRLARAGAAIIEVRSPLQAHILRPLHTRAMVRNLQGGMSLSPAPVRIIIRWRRQQNAAAQDGADALK